MKVHFVTYEWRNWSRDIFAFATEAQASAHVIAQANEAQTDMDAEPITEFDVALDALTTAGHSVNVDELDVLSPVLSLQASPLLIQVDADGLD